MRLQAEVGGRRHDVEVENRLGGGVSVVLDGRDISVDARALEGFFTSLLMEGKAYEVTVEPDGDGAWRVQVGIDAHRVHFIDPLRPQAGGMEEQARDPGGRRGRAAVTSV